MVNYHDSQTLLPSEVALEILWLFDVSLRKVFIVKPRPQGELVADLDMALRFDSS
jgi:hypothetical protein